MLVCFIQIKLNIVELKAMVGFNVRHIIGNFGS